MTSWGARILAVLLLAAALIVALRQRVPASQLPATPAPAGTPAQPFPSDADAAAAVATVRGRTVPRRSGGAGTPGARRRGAAVTPTAVTAAASASPEPATPEAVNPAVTAEPAPSSAPITLPPLDDLINAVPARVGLVIETADGTPLLQHNADAAFEAASLYKLGIMVEVYRQRELGQLQFSDTLTLWPGYFVEDDPLYGWGDIESDVPIGELLRNMIVVSSNVAAEALLDRVGTDNVNATMAQLGLNQTQIRWYPDKGIDSGPNPFDFSRLPSGNGDLGIDAPNITSPQDMARLFLLLLQGQVVSPAVSAEMLDLLSQQEINDRLPAELPDGTQVAHKTGNLDDVVHDAGVIYAPRGPIIVTILTDQVEDEGAVDEFMSQVARAAYDAAG